MNKKKYFYIISFVCIMYSQSSFSDEKLPDTVLNISLDVVNVTCNINDGKGFNKVVDFGIINEAELLSGKSPSVKNQFIVDCRNSGVIPNNIDVKFRPGSQGAINDGAEGKLKTNLSGVGIYLFWPDNSPVDLSGANKQFNSINEQFKIEFLAKPYAQTKNVDMGLMKSSVIIDMLYK